jgi:hypothetical protein
MKRCVKARKLDDSRKNGMSITGRPVAVGLMTSYDQNY